MKKTVKQKELPKVGMPLIMILEDGTSLEAYLNFIDPNKGITIALIDPDAVEASGCTWLPSKDENIGKVFCLNFQEHTTAYKFNALKRFEIAVKLIKSGTFDQREYERICGYKQGQRLTTYGARCAFK